MCERVVYFFVDSSQRNRDIYPTPSEYAIQFSAPFKNVFSLQVLDASIPRTQYNIDTHNNSLCFSVLDSINYSSIEYDNSWQTVSIEVGDYSDIELITAINQAFRLKKVNIELSNVSDPGDQKNIFRFISTDYFILDMSKSSIRTVIGFDENAKSSDNNILYRTVSNFPSRFESIRNIEIDPIKYSTFSAFNQTFVDTNTTSSDSSTSYNLESGNAVFQQFIVNTDTDGVYGFTSSITIYVPPNNEHKTFSIALVRQTFDYNTNANVFEKMNLGNTETVTIEPNEITCTWLSSNDNGDVLTPGTYYIVIYNVRKGTPSDIGEQDNLLLDTI